MTGDGREKLFSEGLEWVSLEVQAWEETPDGLKWSKYSYMILHGADFTLRWSGALRRAHFRSNMRETQKAHMMENREYDGH
ncbi:hypothetical protein N7481_002947 [Penicillium waksmanii]|uniref:uncharacterized protein n=1 Tax=Penicillium waksmanii TaxID=69791 RepID=UPI002549752C|nr:uncharacterized protein N7481_002947 [Penicillium waksmanii]KAJ5987737.1 hypothetical protein N7481_002947 [Penicillium waksmanii]